VHLRVRVTDGARCEFSVSTGGVLFSTIGNPFQTRAHRWVGVRVGLFASAPADAPSHGSVDVQEFRIT